MPLNHNGKYSLSNPLQPHKNYGIAIAWRAAVTSRKWLKKGKKYLKNHLLANTWSVKLEFYRKGAGCSLYRNIALHDNYSTRGCDGMATYCFSRRIMGKGEIVFFFFFFFFFFFPFFFFFFFFFVFSVQLFSLFVPQKCFFNSPLRFK